MHQQQGNLHSRKWVRTVAFQVLSHIWTREKINALLKEKNDLLIVCMPYCIDAEMYPRALSNESIYCTVHVFFLLVNISLYCGVKSNMQHFEKLHERFSLPIINEHEITDISTWNASVFPKGVVITRYIYWVTFSWVTLFGEKILFRVFLLCCASSFLLSNINMKYHNCCLSTLSAYSSHCEQIHWMKDKHFNQKYTGPRPTPKV